MRMNLQTGQVEAKLMEEDSKKDQAVVKVSEDDEEDQDKSFHRSEGRVDGVEMFTADDGSSTIFSGDKFDKKRIQEALQNMEGDDVEVASEEVCC